MLGIDWYKQNDNVIIDLNGFTEIGIYLTSTKKTLLQVIARIYDPIGIV